jgi:hypothetical protein
MKELLDTHWKDKTVRSHFALSNDLRGCCEEVLLSCFWRLPFVQVIFVGDSINSLVYHAAVRSVAGGPMQAGC